MGNKNQKAIIDSLHSSTIYLQYSQSEGFCNAVLEAQSMGKLCVVSNAEGLAENILHGHSGWVVPKYAPKLLAAQINDVLVLSPEEKRRFSQNAVDRVRDEFTIEQQEAKFVAFFGGTAKAAKKAQSTQ